MAPLVAPAVPLAVAAQAANPLARSLAALQAPSLIEASAPLGAETSRAAARADFDVRIGVRSAEPGVAVDVAVPARHGSAALLLSSRGLSSKSTASSASTAAVPKAERRSAYFPIAAAAAAAVATAAVHALSLLIPGAGASGQEAGQALMWIHATASALSWASVAGAGALVLVAAADLGAFIAAMTLGARVTDGQFAAFLRSETAAGRLNPGVAALIRPFRPERRFRDLTFGFSAGGFIYLRPELIALPWLFRVVLVHEHHHLKALKARGPPAGGGWRGVWTRLRAETGARVAELRGPNAAEGLKISVLERALRQAQLSLRLDQAYDVLVINPASAELGDPGVYRDLSGDMARVESVTTSAPQDVLGRQASQYRAVVLDQAAASLPPAHSREAARLESALRQLDSLYVLAARRLRQGNGGFRAGSGHARRYNELAEKAESLGRAPGKAGLPLERQIQDFWREIASARLSGLAVTALIQNLYGGLADKGIAFLSFGAGEGGIASWEKLLRYWEATDGGQFRVTRVDLEDGGHILVLRKIESRVGLWLQPQNGTAIRLSVPDAAATAQSRAAARQALADAGFAGELSRFDELGVEISQIFGADVARQEIFITIPRRNAAAVRRYVINNGHHFQPSQTNFQTELMDSPAIHRAPAAWKLGVTGADESSLWIDTGGDATHEDFEGRLDRVDMVHEGPEDWIGHGTHVVGISISGGGVFTGIARAARGIVAKVFGRDTPGAADGPIMGAGAIGLQKGVSMVVASLGAPGNAASNLSRFFSDLMLQPNSRGEYMLFAGSAGNSGPFDRSLSSPGNAKNGLTVAAAAKSLDDLIPEVSFFSAVGPDEDPSNSVPRLTLKPDITMIGGDVVTDPGDPNVYKRGVYSLNSKDKPASHADTADGRYTGMAGTSMAAPMAAGLALLVRSALRRSGAERALSPEDVPLAVKAIMLRTADDMQVPTWFQGAGLGNAQAAVTLALAAGPDPAALDWVSRYKGVLELEDKIYRATALAKSQAQARFEETSSEDPETPPEGRAAMGNAVAAEAVKTFNAERPAAVAALREALKDPVWLVRRQAAFTLLNLRTSEAAMDLAETALYDEDQRVRQMAFLALAETPTHSVDVLLQKASSDSRWDVGLYAAYALARRGDTGGVARLAAETASTDKKTRFSAVWLLGQLRARASVAEAETLSRKVADIEERGNIRHLAAAALTNLATSAPAAISDQVIADLLGAAGPKNLALTRTISKFFPAAASNKALVERLRQPPLSQTVTDFVRSNKGSVHLPGALGELVQLLARLLELSLDDPTPVLDPAGAGVAGVDRVLGSLDVIIGLPDGRAPQAYWDPTRGDPAAILARAGLSVESLERLEVRPRAALPLTKALWLSVPEHKLYALRVEMGRVGLAVRLSAPFYSAASIAAPEPDAEKEIPLVRIRAGAGTSEARLLAELESVSAAAEPLRQPVVISLDASGAPSRGGASMLAALSSLLILNNIGVIVPAGNEGPRPGSVSTPADGGLAVVVAAASPAMGFEHYSSPGRGGEAPISWTDLVDDPSQTAARGTGVAAERSAEKVAAMARMVAAAYAAAGRAMPSGWFFLVRSAVERSLRPMPGHAVHEVGGGLFADAEAAAGLLARRLENLDEADIEARAAMAAIRRQTLAHALVGAALPAVVAIETAVEHRVIGKTTLE